MEAATKSIEIASFYWTLNGSDIAFHDNSSWEGETVLKTLAKAGHDRKIPIKIAQNEPNGVNANTDYLAKYAGAQVRTLNFKKWFGSGILHTKMWLIDRQHFYVAVPTSIGDHLLRSKSWELLYTTAAVWPKTWGRFLMCTGC